MGERKLKGTNSLFDPYFDCTLTQAVDRAGLESAELISLIWPKALKERVEKPGETSEKKTEVIEDDTPQLLDVQTIKSLGKVVQRVSFIPLSYISDDANQSSRCLA